MPSLSISVVRPCPLPLTYLHLVPVKLRATFSENDPWPYTQTYLIVGSLKHYSVLSRILPTVLFVYSDTRGRENALS